MEINSYSSVGSLKLNMTKEEIQSQLNEVPEYLQGEEEPTEYYKEAGVLVHYSQGRDISRAFEFVNPSKPTINGVCFLNMKAKNALRILKELDSSVIEVADTHISEKLGVSLYILDDKVETVLVFEQGYYDEMLELLAELDNEI